MAAEVKDVPINQDVQIIFSEAVDSISAKQNITIKNEENIVLSGLRYVFQNDAKTVIIKHADFGKLKSYTLNLDKTLKGSKGQTFAGAVYRFKTDNGVFTLKNASINKRDFLTATNIYNINNKQVDIELEFSQSLDTNDIKSKFTLGGNSLFQFSFEDSFKKVKLTSNQLLSGYSKYVFIASTALRSTSGYSFPGFSNSFMTTVDSTPKFPLISDEELLTLVQQQTFRFFYDYAHPASGMTRERNNSGDLVTSGGSGFGVMALIVGIERGFITREQGITRLDKIVTFLETCDRFHGAWSHWINGATGAVIPFGTKDNGGDLVETAFMAQGLITMRQYLDAQNPVENDLINRITTLYNEIEWSWYRRNNQNVLYWHWSPNYGWEMNHQIAGYNETLITYVMAAASPTYTIPANVYHQGYARNGAIRNGKSFYGYTLPVGFDYGGPLFFAHYSFMGLDPRNLSDAYANYWTQNTHHALINYSYCAANPKGYPNYSSHCWGLTAGDIPGGYGVSEPTNDRGVITPTAAVASLPFSPEQSMNAIRFFYYTIGDKLWGNYGFYDAFDVHAGWWASSYLAIDQGPIIVMIENHRTGLLWNLFMSAPEVQQGLDKLGFTY
ncbi:MAG TPA: glucoamylase family protein [Bacteroidales bacterium]|nr:glucoamylase family protein [Bacteroidales bacterium]